MTVILTGASSEELERLFHQRKPGVDWRNADRIEDSASILQDSEPPDMRVLRPLIDDSWMLRELPKPLETLVANAAGRRNNRLAHARALQTLPPRSLIRLASGLYTCSPEYRFVQSAKSNYPPAQAVVGTGLVSIHLEDATSEDGFVECLPRTTPELIADFLAGCEGVHGAKQSRKVLRYLLPNARSPMESVLAVICALPPRWGGYGLEGLMLDSPVSAGSGATYKADIFFPDISWDLEYDGNLRHSGARAMSADHHRRIMLENAGVTVVTLAYCDASNISTMNGIVRRILRARGMCPEPPSRELLLERNQLFASLMPAGSVSCDPASEAARWQERAARLGRRF